MRRESHESREPVMPPLSLRASLRYDVVRRWIEHIDPSTILEIGCGQGAVGARLAKSRDYTGVEPDDTSYEVARERIAALGGVVLHGLHTRVPAEETFDLVCAFEVLEHIEDDREALVDWIRFVRPGGHLMLSVPAFQERFGAWDTLAGHFRRYSPADLSLMLKEAGLVDIQIVVYGWPVDGLAEHVRNWVAGRRADRTRAHTVQELTAASGRRLQPSGRASGALLAAVAAPLRILQRTRPTRGTGLVAVARRPG